jgi:hypothetical protein
LYNIDKASGVLLEGYTGLLEEDNAEDCIMRKVEEETGYNIDKIR